MVNFIVKVPYNHIKDTFKDGDFQIQSIFIKMKFLYQFTIPYLLSIKQKLKKIKANLMNSLIKKLAIGSVQFGQKYGISNKNGIVIPKEVHAILNLANENGIDTIDTAKEYGRSENVIGQYINEKKTKWKIISKYKNYDEGIMHQFLRSAKLLNTKPTIVLAHNVNFYMDSRFQKEVQQLRDEGFIKKIGVSIYSKKEIDIVLKSKLKPEVVQLPINILDNRLYHYGCLERLVAEKVQIHARSIFLQGLFYLTPLN